MKCSSNIPQPLYNTIVGVQTNFRVSYPIHVITRVKCIIYIAKSVFDDHLGSSNDQCYIQNRVITNRVIKRLRCTNIDIRQFWKYRFHWLVQMFIQGREWFGSDFDEIDTCSLVIASNYS